MLKKIVETGGKTLGIRFNPLEIKLYNLNEGNIIEIEEPLKVREIKDLIKYKDKEK